jgi:hypothetical protein
MISTFILIDFLVDWAADINIRKFRG